MIAEMGLFRTQMMTTKMTRERPPAMEMHNGSATQCAMDLATALISDAFGDRAALIVRPNEVEVSSQFFRIFKRIR